MKGRAIRLSLRRRAVADFLHLGKRVPAVPVERLIDIATLQAPLASRTARPRWSALLSKAFALVARDIPDLRRAYLSLPFPRLYEYPVSIANLAIERSHDGETTVSQLLIKDPAARPLLAITRAIDRAKFAPIEELSHFRTILAVARLPWPLRRAIHAVILNSGRQRANYIGTFGVSTFGPYGVAPMRAISPFTAFVTSGPFENGKVRIRGTFDHRVLDGTLMARSLVRIEDVLNTVILDELRTMKDHASGAPQPPGPTSSTAEHPREAP
jgi:hypothetical protein